MNQETYETVDVDADVIGEDGKYLKRRHRSRMAMHEGRPVALQLPEKIQYKVVEAPPAVRGDSAGGNVTKKSPSTTASRCRRRFYQRREEILVNTETGEYGGRASE